MRVTRKWDTAAVTSQSVPFTDPFETLLDADITRLALLQALFQNGSQVGTWCTPEKWLPPNARLPYRKSANLKARIQHHLRKEGCPTDSPLIETAVVAATRYLLMLRAGPSGLGVKARNRSIDVTTISKMAHEYVPALYAFGIKAALKLPAPSADHLLRYIDLADLRSRGTHTSKIMLVELDRMRMLRDRGLWRDVPDHDKPKMSSLMTADEPQANEDDGTDIHLPLPDDYVAKMASRSLWLSDNLCRNVIAVLEELLRGVDRFIRRNRRRMSEVMFLRLAKDVLLKHEWVDEKGSAISAIPFHFSLPKEQPLQTLMRRRKGDYSERPPQWPPQNARDLSYLVGTIQTAHYFIVALSIGARASEALGLTRGCIARTAEGTPYISGKTYKLVESFEGEERDWHIPDIAVSAIERQSLLIDLTERLHTGYKSGTRPSDVAVGTNLWGRISTQSKKADDPLTDINRKLRNYAMTLGMDVNPGGQNIRSHRFRKTLARLVALALDQAPKLLMEIFGHKYIEMTLHYILSDPALAAEIQTVRRELKVMMAKTAIEDIVAAEFEEEQPDTGGYGGIAAEHIVFAIDSHRARLHRQGKAWGQNTAFELAELLTMNGTAWELVRPGVICTKVEGEVGACTKKRGRADAGNCKVDCDHRLEQKFLHDDVDAVIEDSLQHLERARADNDIMLESFWAAHVRKNVPRFYDLEKKWMRNPTVSDLFAPA